MTSARGFHRSGTRENAARRGYGRRWREARVRFLAARPLCAACGSRGIVAAAEVVDHVAPHGGDMALFWDQGNWQPLCKPCHDAKTAREDGGFGNAKPTGDGGRYSRFGNVWLGGMEKHSGHRFVDRAGRAPRTPAKLGDPETGGVE